MVNKLSYMKLHEAACVTETLLFFFLFIEICQPLPLDKRKPFNQWKTDIPVPRWNSLVQVLYWKVNQVLERTTFPPLSADYSSSYTFLPLVLTGLLHYLPPYRLPHTSRFFVKELQIFSSGWNRVKICRAISLPLLKRGGGRLRDEPKERLRRKLACPASPAGFAAH